MVDITKFCEENVKLCQRDLFFYAELVVAIMHSIDFTVDAYILVFICAFIFCLIGVEHTDKVEERQYRSCAPKKQFLDRQT